MRRKLLVVILLILLSIQGTGCGTTDKVSTDNRYKAQFLDLFDTVTSIIGYAEDKDTFTKEAQMIHDTLKEYHELYDIYHNYDGINNIKTINDNAGIAPVKVDQRVIDLLLFAKEMYDLSDGKVNVAAGAVLKVWHDYREAGTEDPTQAELPPMELLKEKAEHTDISKMIIDEAAGTVYLEDPEMSLDVGAIAKGYATEMVAQYMKEQGYTSILLSVGGNIRAIGSRQEKEKAWNVGIQNPDKDSEKEYLLLTRIEDFSLVSSGDYERYYTVNGKEYHHIIDPDTLMPAEYFTAVSIITEHSGLADALSTTIYNMPLEEGMELIEGLPDTEAMWVMKDGQLIYSSRFQSYVKE